LKKIERGKKGGKGTRGKEGPSRKGGTANRVVPIRDGDSII